MELPTASPNTKPTAASQNESDRIDGIVVNLVFAARYRTVRTLAERVAPQERHLEIEL